MLREGFGIIWFSPRLLWLATWLFVFAGCHADAHEEIVSPPEHSPGEHGSSSMPGVDLSQMTDHEVEAWTKLTQEMLSPCGDPMNLANCAQAGSKCAACVPAAGYLARLVMEGYEAKTIVEHYRGRFDSNAKKTFQVSDAPFRGPPMAPITIVEFSDFQCPYCGRAHPMLQRALAAGVGKVKLIFKHYPLPGHPRALPAAKAAEAARLQGKFWEMHDMLFEHQDRLEDGDLSGYAQSLGLDVAKFEADLASDLVAGRIDANRAEGHKAGVDSTPSIYVNGRKFRESPRTLEAYLREEIDL